MQALRASIAAGEDPRATRRSTLLELEAAIVHSTSLANGFKLEDNDLELAIKVSEASTASPLPVHTSHGSCLHWHSRCLLTATEFKLLLPFVSSDAFVCGGQLCSVYTRRQVCEERVKDMMTTIANHSEEVLVRGGVAHWMSSDILSVI